MTLYVLSVGPGMVFYTDLTEAIEARDDARYEGSTATVHRWETDREDLCALLNHGLGEHVRYTDLNLSTAIDS